MLQIPYHRENGRIKGTLMKMNEMKKVEVIYFENIFLKMNKMDKVALEEECQDMCVADPDCTW